ncbi:MFS general substrate transporter [Chlorella sorokiniana]|uniref:MFS general substrate transporter n=1 Tax=Chlorella sorokiniana TaxID=3076 RepID=A0A2P6TJ41_CHLSO|nr:MFS general substrate transporter [Chlorella sorokiniana]|eukprot:PRW39266.1 MFS general substrate transporter [Chlorella sorokiniana]
MVGFGKALAAQLEAQPAWREHYLDYGALKRAIKACREAAAGATDRPALARLLDACKAIFQGQLDTQVLKVLRFYRQESAALLEDVRRTGADVQAAVDPEYLRHMAHSLKKFAKNVGGATNEPVPGFLTLEIEHPDDPAWRVLQGSYLPAAAAEDLHAMQEHRELRQAMEQLRLMFQEVSEARRHVVERASMTLPSESALGAMADQLAGMERAQEEAARHSALVHAVPWVERAAGMFEPPPPDRFAVATLAGLVLNNLSTLLFMANYTAVLPPTDALCVHIGVPSSYTGLIMAASDLAALFASVGISFWTQRSFKQPLLFSAAACLAGNILFVLSYQWRSLAALLAARLLNGCGSARTANRRYTADYVSRAQRTTASAAFVGASNLGMALGPLLSLPLANVPDWQLQSALQRGKPGKRAAAAGWRATVPGTVACTLALLVQKMVQQAYLDSLPLFTEVLLSWRSSQKGLFLGLVSLAMVPVNAAVGAASARISDRLMVCAAVVLCTLCLAALAWAATAPPVFFAAGVLLFVGTVVLEGTATSLMSKVIWSGFAMGVLNAGLLSTEAGTLGRFVGNGLLAAAGKLTGLDSLSQMAAFARLLFFSLAAACLVLLVQLACTYHRLQG